MEIFRPVFCIEAKLGSKVIVLICIFCFPTYFKMIIYCDLFRLTLILLECFEKPSKPATLVGVRGGKVCVGGPPQGSPVCWPSPRPQEVQVQKVPEPEGGVSVPWNPAFLADTFCSDLSFSRLRTSARRSLDCHDLPFSLVSHHSLLVIWRTLLKILENSEK